MSKSSDKPDLIAVLRHWVENFDPHFFVEEYKDHFYQASICCKCPSQLTWTPSGVSYSGVGFLWVDDKTILARPETFWFDGGPGFLTNIHTPEMFSIMEKRLKILHKIFLKDRK